MTVQIFRTLLLLAATFATSGSPAGAAPAAASAAPASVRNTFSGSVTPSEAAPAAAIAPAVRTHARGGFIALMGADFATARARLAQEEGCRYAVVELQALSGAQVAALREAAPGVTLLAYLNVGSLEAFRPYYAEFQHLALGAYAGWEDEVWIDVADERWRAFICGRLAPALVQKGADGFFIDNCDVYGRYPSEAAYRGLCQLLSTLRAQAGCLVVNGGDEFVSRLIATGGAAPLFGVCQECVFSAVTDYRRDSFARQRPDVRRYFLDYLAAARAQGLAVFVIEYTRSARLRRTITSYCRAHGDLYYIARSVRLD